MSEANLFDLDAYLDADLNAIPDLPDFVVPPAGSHLVRVKAPKIDTEKGDVIANFSYLSLIELANPEAGEEAPKPDSLMSENYRQGKDNSDPTVGLSRMKKQWELVMQKMGWTTLRELVNGMEGLEVAMTTKVRKYKDKDNNDRTSMQIVTIVVPE